MAADNTTIAVTFSEAVFDTTGGSGALEVGDFSLTISGGTATINAAPSSISISDNVYTLGLNLSGTPDGSEIVTVVPSSATAIYDAVANAASTSQSNNTVSLNDEAVPTNQNTVFANAISKKGGATVTIVSSGDAMEEFDGVLPTIHKYPWIKNQSYYNEEGISVQSERPPHTVRVDTARDVNADLNITQDGVMANIIENGGGDVTINITQSQ